MFYIFGVSFTPPSLHQFNIEIALHRYVAQLKIILLVIFTHTFFFAKTHIYHHIYIYIAIYITRYKYIYIYIQFNEEIIIKIYNTQNI